MSKYMPLAPTVYGMNFERIRALKVLHVPESAIDETLTDDASPQIRVVDGILKLYVDGVWKEVGAVKTLDEILDEGGTTTSAKLAGIISDETGSDKLVFSDSPTFTGTPIVPDVATGTSSGQAINSKFVQDELNANIVYFDATQIAGSGTFSDPYTIKQPRYRWSLAADFPTTSLSFVDIGLTTGTLAVGTYDFEAIMYTSCTATTGLQCQIATTGTMSGIYLTVGRTTGSTAISHGHTSTFNSVAGGTFNTAVSVGYMSYRGTIVVSVAGIVSIQGKVITSGTGTFLTHSRLVLTKIL